VKIHLTLFILLCWTYTTVVGQDIHDTSTTVIIYGSKNIKKTFADLSSVKAFSLQQTEQATFQSLDEFVNNNSTAFIKKLGVNSLSTLSLRGSSSSQSLVIWEGLPIQNSLNGATDLSLFNAGLFDQLQIDYDGNSALYGTGNIGGALHLNTAFAHLPQWTAKINAGSYNKYGVFTSIKNQVNAHQYYAKALVSQEKNNFPYAYLGEENRLEHAQHKSMSVLGGYSWTPEQKKYNLTYHLWLQKNYREIPPALFEQISTKKQDEFSIRHNLRFEKNINSQHTFYIHNGWLIDQHQFKDSVAFLQQELQAHNVYSEWGLTSPVAIEWKKFNLKYLIFIPIQYHHLDNVNTQEEFHNLLSGLAANFQVSSNNLILQANVRQELTQNYKVPFLWGIKAAYFVNAIHTPTWQHHFHIFSSLQRSFRAPLLQELHQFPGGNINLQPEHGYNLETGIKSQHAHHSSHYHLSTQWVYFNKYIYNWIYWLGATIWTPYNIAEVSSHGWDIQIKNTFNIHPHLSIIWGIDHLYNIATTQHSLLPNHQSLNKQIPYTPRYSTRSHILINYRKSKWHFGAQYTGYVFTTLDESMYLEPYLLFNTSWQTPIATINKCIINASLSINNLTNKTYFTIQNRPMPGRNVTLSIQLTSQ